MHEYRFTNVIQNIRSFTIWQFNKFFEYFLLKCVEHSRYSIDLRCGDKNWNEMELENYRNWSTIGMNICCCCCRCYQIIPFMWPVKICDSYHFHEGWKFYTNRNSIGELLFQQCQLQRRYTIYSILFLVNRFSEMCEC